MKRLELNCIKALHMIMYYLSCCRLSRCIVHVNNSFKDLRLIRIASISMRAGNRPRRPGIGPGGREWAQGPGMGPISGI